MQNLENYEEKVFDFKVTPTSGTANAGSIASGTYVAN